jgi:hypothetical protein
MHFSKLGHFLPFSATFASTAFSFVWLQYSLMADVWTISQPLQVAQRMLRVSFG